MEGERNALEDMVESFSRKSSCAVFFRVWLRKGRREDIKCIPLSSAWNAIPQGCTYARLGLDSLYAGVAPLSCSTGMNQSSLS